MDNNYNFFHSAFLPFARKDNSLRINRLVGLLENWEMGLLVKIARRTRVALGKLLPTVQNEKRQLEAVFFVLSGKREFNLCSPIILSAKIGIGENFISRLFENYFRVDTHLEDAGNNELFSNFPNA